MHNPGGFGLNPPSSAFGPVLVGMPGSGKTTVGAIGARALGMQCIDTDNVIAEQQGITVPRIIERLGESRFREIERAVAAQALGVAGAVVATGGGIVVHEDLHPILCSRRTVWLHADPALLACRMDRSDHPLLSGEPMEQRLRMVLAVREPLYRKVSSLRVETTDVDPEGVAKLIVGWLERSTADN